MPLEPQNLENTRQTRVHSCHARVDCQTFSRIGGSFVGPRGGQAPAGVVGNFGNAATSGRPTASSAEVLFLTTGDRQFAAITYFRCSMPPRTVRFPAGVLTLAVSSRLASSGSCVAAGQFPNRIACRRSAHWARRFELPHSPRLCRTLGSSRQSGGRINVRRNAWS